MPHMSHIRMPATRRRSDGALVRVSRNERGMYAAPRADLGSKTLSILNGCGLLSNISNFTTSRAPYTFDHMIDARRYMTRNGQCKLLCLF